MNRRVIWQATKAMLSAKFAQGEILVVDDFNLSSHKTKHVVQSFRRLVGDRCNSALCCHEGTRDVNDNFRWATGHIAAVRRCNVEGLDVYKLVKYRFLILTEAALQKLIFLLQNYPKKRGWGPSHATPDGRRVAREHLPQKIPGWNAEWVAKKQRLRNSEFRAKIYAAERRKWKWSPELQGPLKIPAADELDRFRLMNFNAAGKEERGWEALEDLYVDDEPLGEGLEEEDEWLDLFGEEGSSGFSGASSGSSSSPSSAASGEEAPEQLLSKPEVQSLGLRHRRAGGLRGGSGSGAESAAGNAAGDATPEDEVDYEGAREDEEDADAGEENGSRKKRRAAL